MPNSATLYRAAMLPGNDLGNVTVETQFPNGRGAQLNLPLPSNGSLSNKRFALIVSGRVQTTITNTFTLNIYFGFSPTISANTLIFSSGANSVNSVNTGYDITVSMYWNGAALTITGSGEGQMNNNPIGPSGLANTITKVDPARDSSTFLSSGATYGFTLTGTFGSGSAGNHAFTDIFNLEEI